MPTISGRSARAAHQNMSEVARGRHNGQVDPTPVTPPRNEAAGPTPAASAAPRLAPRMPSITATIPTTTTLEATPSPVLYPQQVHIVATVTPVAPIFDGFGPAASFYVDGVLDGNNARRRWCWVG